MPINGIFKTIENSNGAELEKLQSALSYGGQNSAGQQLLNEVAGRNVDLVINHNNLNNTSMSPDGRFTINWDPDTAIQVTDANGNVSNYESPATNLFHEMSHAADPDFATNATAPDSQYDWVGDRVAIERTNSIFVPLGEEGRTNHSGGYVSVDNPTEHTAGGQWVEIGSDGQIRSSTQADGFNDNWNGADSDPDDPGTGGGDDGGGDDGGGDGGGGDGGDGGGGGGGGGGGPDEDMEPIEERVNPAARLDKAKLAASETHASTTLTAHTVTAGAAHSTPIAMDAASLRSASQLVQSMASFGVSSGALSAEHGLAGALHAAQIGLTTAHHPARMAA